MQNTNPIFTLTPNVSQSIIPVANAQVASDGRSAGSGADTMYKVFAAGPSGSYIDRIRFFSVSATANVTGVATTIRAYLSTIASPGTTATTSASAFLLGEVSVPAIASAHSTNATNYYEMVLGVSIPANYFIHVSQHVAQTANQTWLAMAFGGDY